MKTRNKIYLHWILFILVASLFLFTFGECKGGSGGGRGGGSVGGGRGGRSSGRISGKKIALGAAVGAAGYVAYKNNHPKASPHRFHSNPLDNPAFHSGGGASVDDETYDEDYKIQESSYYNRREGFGMSALGIILFILGVIGICTIAWYCMEIGYPLWKDRQAMRQRSLYSKEGIPLQDGTPTTATPSP